MAGNETGDLLMMVLATPGNAISGESSSQPNFSNQLMKGFKPNKMFEITDFSFGTTAATEPDKADGVNKHYVAAFEMINAHPSFAGHPELGQFIAAAKRPDFGKNQGQPKSCPVDEVSFRRPIDMASAVLLQNCIDCKTMHGAVVVKLKPAGGKAAGEAYLRLEFIDVLFTSIGWSNGEPIEENCQFITRAVNVLYRPQLPDGTLGAVKSGFWSRKPDSQGEVLTY